MLAWFMKLIIRDKRGMWNTSLKLIAGGSGIRPMRLEKSSKINSRGPPSIQDSRVFDSSGLIPITSLASCTYLLFPIKQCWSVPETHGIILHEKLFRCCMYFSQKPSLLKGKRRTNLTCRLKMCELSQDFWRLL